MIYSIPILFISFLAADPVPSASPAERLAELAKEGIAIEDNFNAGLKKAGHDMPRVTAANEKYRADSSAWAARASAYKGDGDGLDEAVKKAVAEAETRPK